MSEHGSLDGQQLTDAEDVFWRNAYAAWRMAGCTPDQAMARADEALRGRRDAEAES